MFKKIAVSMLLIASAFNAQAAGSAPFGVTGTITPAACDVTLTGGIANLGVVSTVAMRANAVTTGSSPAYSLANIYVPFNITCSAATRVEVSFVDNHAGKNAPLDTSDVMRFGMIDGAGSTAIGAVTFQLTGQLVDGVSVGQFLISPNGTTAWSAINPAGADASYASPGYTIGVAKVAGATVPDSLTTLSGSLRIKIFINKAYVDSATNSITPNTSGTMSLVYL